MKAALFAALHKSPWLMVVIAIVLLLALWLVLSHSYAFSLRSASGLQLDLKPVPPVAATH